MGYEIPAYTKVVKRKVVQAPKFYYFDVGLANYLMGRHHLRRGSDDYGHAFEHLGRGDDALAAASVRLSKLSATVFSS